MGPALTASRANKIATHGYKLQIFESFRKFNSALAIHSWDFDQADLWPLLECKENAKFYFRPDLAKRLSEYVYAAVDLLIKRDRARALESQNREVPTGKKDEICALADECLDKGKALQPELEADLKLYHHITSALLSPRS